ncbi:hypothetical protein [Hominifimenecus sp. rT4P-3]|uniref:hypothetical protein n=1 Tax=Hominifimenecus sp. rT4P-3 TaxID=3242979 RepID=UPI003DA3AA56
MSKQLTSANSAESGNITQKIRQNMAKYDHRQESPVLRERDFYPPTDHRSRRTPTWCCSDQPYDSYIKEIAIYREK